MSDGRRLCEIVVVLENLQRVVLEDCASSERFQVPLKDLAKSPWRSVTADLDEDVAKLLG